MITINDYYGLMPRKVAVTHHCVILFYYAKNNKETSEKCKTAQNQANECLLLEKDASATISGEESTTKDASATESTFTGDLSETATDTTQ